jgi:hypothetical protein
VPIAKSIAVPLVTLSPRLSIASSVVSTVIKAPTDLSERMTTESTLQNKHFCIKIIAGSYCCKPCESRNLLGYCVGCLANKST